jgi:hypothetical protein
MIKCLAINMLSDKPASIHRHKRVVAEELFDGDLAKNLLFERNWGYICVAVIAVWREWGNDR